MALVQAVISVTYVSCVLGSTLVPVLSANTVRMELLAVRKLATVARGNLPVRSVFKIVK